MSRLSGSGLSVDMPDGWEGRIYTRAADAAPATLSAAPARRETASNAFLHVANFPLPPGAGDYGSGAVELMTNRDLLVILMEHGRSSASTALFAASGIPRLTTDDVDPQRLQRVLEGQGGAQKFFNVAGRAFCLYVVFGSYARRGRTIPVVNGLLGTLTIE
jgi:hypothetical protein